MLIDRLASHDLYVYKLSTVYTKGFDMMLWVVAFALPLLIRKLVGIPRL